MNPEELERLWQNPQYWNTWCYNCKADPRVIVPKRNPRLGWTLNVAHRWSGLVIFIMTVLIILLPLAVVINEGTDFSPVHFALAIVISGMLVTGISAYLSKTPVGKVRG